MAKKTTIIRAKVGGVPVCFRLAIDEHDSRLELLCWGPGEKPSTDPPWVVAEIDLDDGEARLHDADAVRYASGAVAAVHHRCQATDGAEQCARLNGHHGDHDFEP